MIAYRQNFAALVYMPRPKPRPRRRVLSLRGPAVPRPPRDKAFPHGDALPPGDLLQRIERTIEARGINAASFGREAINDPNLVFSLRAGRRIREATRTRILACLDRIEGRQGNGQ